MFAALIVVASLYVDARGRVETARVRAKYERIRTYSTGAWMRTYQAAVGPVGTSGMDVQITVDPKRYDALRVGDPIVVKYAECCPLFARPADRTTVRWMADLGTRALSQMRWFAWSVGGVVLVMWARRLGRLAVLVAAAAWGLAGLSMDAASRARDGLAGSRVAEARVRDVRRVEELTRRRRRAGPIRYRQPFDLATLAFVPARGADTVVTVDAVDAGSVPGLRPGTIARVRFDPLAPRDAALAAGTRTHRARNRPLFLGAAVALVAVTTLVALIAAGGWLRLPFSRPHE